MEQKKKKTQIINTRDRDDGVIGRACVRRAGDLVKILRETAAVPDVVERRRGRALIDDETDRGRDGRFRIRRVQTHIRIAAATPEGVRADLHVSVTRYRTSSGYGRRVLLFKIVFSHFSNEKTERDLARVPLTNVSATPCSRNGAPSPADTRKRATVKPDGFFVALWLLLPGVRPGPVGMTDVCDQ